MITESDKEFGVVIHCTLKHATNIHLAICVKKVNQMLGMVQRTITYKKICILLLMYKDLVRPHLKYAVQVWSPHRLGYLRLIKGVQGRFTRMIPELNSLPYDNEAWLERLNLTTWNIGIIKGIIFNGLGKVYPGSLFTRSRYTNTRGHTCT